MYEPVYSTYCRKIGNGRDLSVAIAPCFGTDFTKYEGWKIYWGMEGKTMKDESFEKKEILIVSEAQWVVEVGNHRDFHVTVTEYTKTLKTPFGEEMDQMLNQKVKEAQKEYRRRKQTEKRLYFYDAVKDRLRLYTDGSSWYNEGYRYRLDVLFTSYFAIDKRYPAPRESCFILGKVRRTIGTKDGELMDFIEPVAEFKLDDEDLDYFGSGSNWQGNIIFNMLRFSILKEEPTGITMLRIQSKMKCNVQEFLKMLSTALEAGDVEKVKEFYNVIYEPQDCSKEKFEIIKKEFGDFLEEGQEVYCDKNRNFVIQYENGEEEIRKASWIAENISRCTNRKVTYLELRQQYKFY